MELPSGRSEEKVVAEDRKEAYLKGGVSTATNTAEPSSKMTAASEGPGLGQIRGLNLDHNNWHLRSGF